VVKHTVFVRLLLLPRGRQAIVRTPRPLGVALAAQAGDPGLNTIRADALKGHIFFLASDEMGGRDSLSPEGWIAAEYIAGFFHRAGLKPVRDRGANFQNFPMVAAHVDREHTYLRATIGTTTRDFAMGPDFTLGRQGNVDAAVRAPLVFAGYGHPSMPTTTSRAWTFAARS
jgi:hypothetical protein